MQKEFKVYKNGQGLFNLRSLKKISARHMVMEFDGTDKLFVDDVIWFAIDKAKVNSDQMLIVHEVINNTTAIIKKTDDQYIKDLRDFSIGEEFTIISTFREVNDNNNN